MVSKIIDANTTTIRDAVLALNNGQAFVFPTETVYGIGVDASNDVAVSSLYHIKQRPAEQPLQILVANLSMAKNLAVFSDQASILAKTFWPGPMTLILSKKPDVILSHYVNSNDDSIGIRIPSHPITHSILDGFGKPIAASSANRSGEASPTDADSAYESVGSSVAMVIDGGPCDIGVSSTIVDLRDQKAKILREGNITQADLSRLLDKC